MIYNNRKQLKRKMIYKLSKIANKMIDYEQNKI